MLRPLSVWNLNGFRRQLMPSIIEATQKRRDGSFRVVAATSVMTLKWRKWRQRPRPLRIEHEARILIAGDGKE
jgi:hypothetical protein